MDYDNILIFLLDKPDIEVSSQHYNNSDVIAVTFFAGKQEVTLFHFLEEEFSALPTFHLFQTSKFGQLAHVFPTKDANLGWICVNQQDSVSVNFECPELAFYESICRHITLLTQLICDPEFNKMELLREFQSNWEQQILFTLNQKKAISKLYCTLPSREVTELTLLKPKSTQGFILQQSHVGLSGDKDESLEQFFDCKGRKELKDSLAISIPLGSISPFMKNSFDDIKNWLFESLQTVSPDVEKRLQNTLYHFRRKEFWLILNFTTPSGTAWIGVSLIPTTKKHFPRSLEKLAQWEVKPFSLELFNQELILPRSGANLTLTSKKVMLVGCGSVGCEVAHKLASAGIGHLTLVDPDTYTTSNLYRHRLEYHYLGWNKAHAITHQLSFQFPWLSCLHYADRLLHLKHPKLLNSYDLIIIAIGSPTHERLFHDYLSQFSPPSVIYTWLEGYGIGGHAVLDIGTSSGCLRCAYVDPETGKRGLASNLNFFKPNQSVVKNYAGCGEMYIPYGAIHSTQTAVMASDLAVRYLEGEITESKKVSWKGEEYDALEQGIELSPRFEIFNSSLKKLSLHHPLCDCCNTEKGITFYHNNITLIISNSVYERILTFKQTQDEDPESAGLLIGYQKSSDAIWVDRITEPKRTDIRKRCSFKLDATAHQKEVDNAFEQSEQLLGYIGTWHTHPEPIPTPSSIDNIDWKTHAKDNPDRQLFFIIAGTKQLVVYSLISGKLVQLAQLEQEEI